MRSPLPTAAAACLSALVAACGGGGGGGGGVVPAACSTTNQKQFVLDVTRDWYLFQNDLPATVNIGDYPTAQELLDALTATARAQGKDRYFSYLTTPDADSSFLLEGQYIGFGFRTSIQTDRLLLPDVYEGSPADLGGLVRGAEIIAIDSGSGYVPMATILVNDPNLEQAFGPATAGVQRGLLFVPTPGDPPMEAVFTKVIVTIPPVPTGGAVILPLPSNPLVPAVGYINLRTFISTAEAPLRSAYAQFRAQGIRNFIVDFRYNGGGLVGIADLVGDLNALGLEDDTDVFERTQFNTRKAANDTVHRFNKQDQSVDPVRIAFITTSATASASELVVNGMKPWVEDTIAIVGSDTYGKPVGQSAFDLTGCDLRMRLVTFRITNANGEGDYYDGLAPTLPFACAASDDLTRDPWDSAESSTAAALAWLESPIGGASCGQVMAAPVAPFLKAQAGFRLPQARTPTAAQAYLPGLF
jgi:C-terminal processing protease CtpA/Prc